jgi:acid phosphatase type 7
VKKALIVIAGIAGLLAGTPLTGGEKIVGGPFTVSVTQRTATMVWIVQTDEMTLRPATGTASRTSPSLRVEKTTFTGLQPNTRYEYAIPDAGDVGTGSFKTAPPAGPVPYRFVVYGDTRTRRDVHQRVIGELMEHGIPDFILHTGDLSS